MGFGSSEGRASVATGRPGTSQTGRPALSSDLARIQGLSLDSRERIYFCDSTNHVVLRIEKNGLLTKIAGTGEGGFNGDGMPATSALLKKPFDVRIDAQDNIYIADFKNHRIRKIGQDGIIHTVAGTGIAGYAGDHGPASLAQLNGPYGTFIDHRNHLFITDSLNHVIRKVDNKGVITTIAGTGTQGYTGDGGAALKAQFNTPESLFVDQAGNIYIGDEKNWALRFIDQQKKIFTLVGTGIGNSAIVGQKGHQSPLNDQESLIVRPNGSVLFTESRSGRVLKLNQSGVVELFAGRGLSS